MSSSKRLVIFYCSLLFLSLFKIDYVQSGSFEKETSMTAKEKKLLDEFKKTVIPRIPAKSYINNYINDDLFFLRWLRGANLDAKAAEKLFMDHLKWREDENIDTIDQEDLTDAQRLFPYFNDHFDKEGRPVAELWMADWLVRTATLAGKQRKGIRNISKMFEMEHRRLFKERAKGKKVAQTVFLCALEGFTILQQACPSCLPVYLTLATLFEQHYPGMTDTINFLSMPSAFDLILRTVKPVLRATTRKALISYVSEQQWAPVIDAMMSREDRSTKVGGTIPREIL